VEKAPAMRAAGLAVRGGGLVGGLAVSVPVSAGALAVAICRRGGSTCAGRSVRRCS
jgi:hypothetical protein